MRGGVAALLIGVGLVGCADDGPAADPYRCIAAGGEACFELPTDVVGAANATGMTVLPVLDCAPYEVVMSGGPIAFSGLTADLADPVQPVGGVRLEAFADMTMTSLLFDVTSAVDGTWSASTSVPNLLFARTTGADQLPLHSMYRRLDVADPTQELFDFQTATKVQITSVFEAAGDRFLPGKSQLTAVAYDCAGNKLVNVIANIAPVSGKNGSRLFEPNVRTYYGVAGQMLQLGRRTELMQTSSAGVIGIANIPPGMHYVQMWGFPDAASLTQGGIGLELLAEHELFVGDAEAGYLMPLYGRL